MNNITIHVYQFINKDIDFAEKSEDSTVIDLDKRWVHLKQDRFLKVWLCNIYIVQNTSKTYHYSLLYPEGIYHLKIPSEWNRLSW